MPRLPHDGFIQWLQEQLDSDEQMRTDFKEAFEQSTKIKEWRDEL